MDMKIYFPGGKKVYADFNGFTHKTDQQARGGGEGSAPAPFDLFLASMGTCAGIYVLGFCQQRNINAEGMELKQSLSVNPATGLVDRVHIQINLPADFPEKYADALIRVAQLCAVKRHLENPPEFKITTRIKN
ncbi:MAG: OsmC family protein [Candidatus Marinimicrobia bacterium]|nr:OsmC family protein [Candidatus Neomarinimicrobiota bacterium]